MAYRSAWCAPEVHEVRRQPPETSRLTAHWRPQRSVVPRDKGKAVLTKRMLSASPLRTIDTNRMSPGKARPVLSATASIASRTSSLPATPLDEIPENLWPRVLRTATTPEASTPELSIDEITSTRLSLDDQAILTTLPKNGDRKEGQTYRAVSRSTFGSMWEENNSRFKKMTKKLKNIPSGLFTRKDRPSRETLTPATTRIIPSQEPSLPQLELTPELYIPTTRMSSNSGNSTHSKPVPLMDYECKPKKSDPESRQEEMAKISSLIRKDLHEARNRDCILPSSRTGIVEPLPPHFLRAPTYNSTASASAGNLAQVAEDRLLHGPRSLKANSRHGIGRATSVGSVEEMRTHAFGSRRTNRPSLSSFPLNHNSAPSISRTSYSTCRPATHSGSVSSISATLVPQKPLLFMDGRSTGSESLWRIPDLRKPQSTSSSARPISNGAAAGNIHGDDPTPSTNSRPVADIGVGFGDLPEYSKIPLCVPRRVEPSRHSRNSEEDGLAEDNQWLSRHSEMTVSTPTFSDRSFGSLSLHGQWSIRSHLERQAMEWEQEKEHVVRGSRAMALYATLFRGGRQ
ncbi:hypothetical protein PV04_02756 [Phialophora macrospora]|uniref:Uncharacterized protein n=1 Tax=Phialophora macrospora TaxID=1851006 RepID=A0A0D2E870_9EURO|nr:hypothetical protein PV04_02756 [Phialophora macrospora]